MPIQQQALQLVDAFFGVLTFSVATGLIVCAAAAWLSNK